MKNTKRRARVYIINDSGHDYSKAEEYGDLVYLTSGSLNVDKTNQHYRILVDKMKDAREGDYLLVTSLASINAIAGWITGILGFSLNLLIFRGTKYNVYNIVPRLLTEGEDK